MRVKLTGPTTLFCWILAGVLCLAGSSLAADDAKPEIMRLLNDGDTTTAINLLTKETESDPGYYVNYYQLGMIAFNRAQYEEAVGYFETALEKKKRHYSSMYHLGLALLHLDRVDEAEEIIAEGRKRAKKEEKAWFENGYGLVMMARENYEEADRAFRAALVIDEENPEYHLNLGDACFFQGIPSLAVGCYEKALAADTGSTEVYFHWAEACLEMKDYQCAMEQLKVVLIKDSTYAPAWMRAGGIYFRAARSTRSRTDQKARFMETIGSYKRYLELSGTEPDSSSVRVFFELAMAYGSIGRAGAEDAAKYFEAVLAIPYEARDIYFHYGKALWGVQDFPKAAEMLKKHMEWAEREGEDANSKVDDWELFQYLGDCYFYVENKDYYQAAKWYQQSIDLRPEQKRIAYNLAVAYHNRKDFGRALHYYQHRIDLGIDTSYAGVYKNAGYCALNIANKDEEGEEDPEAEEEEGEAIEVVDEYISDTLNYYEVAADYITQYLDMKPEDTKALLLVANTYLYQLSDCERGVEFYKKLLDVDPSNCDAKKALGYAYFGGICTKNYSRALGYLLDAQKCIAAANGNCGDVDLMLWIAQCYHLRAVDANQKQPDDFKKANNWYTKCYDCDPSNAECKKGRDDTSYEF